MLLYTDLPGGWRARGAPAGGEVQVHPGHLRSVVHLYGGDRHPRLHHEGVTTCIVSVVDFRDNGDLLGVYPWRWPFFLRQELARFSA